MTSDSVCPWCKGINPGLTVDDRSFLDRLAPKIGSQIIEIPAPKLCPECRQQRRFWFRNDQNLYRDKCRICEAPVVTNYTPPRQVPILCEQCFWSDRWDPLSYGRDFDFGRPFFEQFLDLKRDVPRLAIYNTQSENSQYTVHSSRNKNCYWSSSVVDCEELLYCDFCNRSQNCLDLFSCQEMELCYECLFCSRCYNTDYSEHCHGVIDGFLCFDCRASTGLVGCVGLRSKTNYILNQPASVQEVRETVTRLKSDRQFRVEFEAEFERLKNATPRPPNWASNVEHCSGNYQTSCKNLFRSFNVLSVEDGRYVYECYIDKDLYDCTRAARSELIYECSGVVDLRFSAFCVLCYQSDNLLYCDNCQGASRSFGSVSLKKHQHCILNQQYSAAEYERLVLEITEHMKRTGEWGEFFPPALSPFYYNETKASDWYPLSRVEVEQRGGEWSEFEPPLPPDIRRVSFEEIDRPVSEFDDLLRSSILNGAVVCELSNKPFRIVLLELDFYRQKGLRIPRHSPRLRHQNRIKRLASRVLQQRFCEHCGEQVETSYQINQPELVYCEACYLDSLS